MFNRPIPRFSPSFSPLELRAAVGSMLGRSAATVGDFEAAFSRYIGVEYGVMSPSARVGLYTLLAAWDLEEGDEILIPSLTYFAIPSVVLALGLKPVFVDVGRDTYVMDPEDLARKITSRSKVIIPTHLYGMPCDMAAINALAQKHSLKVVEDVAQATGARFQGKALGSWADAAYYTFGLTKNITTLKGAMVTTNDGALADRIRQKLGFNGAQCKKPLAKEAMIGTAMMMVTRPYFYPMSLYPFMRLQGAIGKDFLEEAFGEPMVRYDSEPAWFYASSPGDVQAAVGLVQLKRIDGLNGLRASHGRYLLEHLRHAKGFRLLKVVEGGEPIFMSFPIQVAQPKIVQKRLLTMGVDTARGYMRNCADMELYAGRVGGTGTCPNAAAIESGLLHIPVHPNLKRSDLAHIVESVRRATFDQGDDGLR